MHFIEQSAELIQYTKTPSFLIEKIARVCYNSEDKMKCQSISCTFDNPCSSCVNRNGKFIRNLASRGHESVFEHGSATFKLVTDRGVTHELVRHRLASYTQESTRYVKFDNLPIIKPMIGDEDFEKAKKVLESIESAYTSFLTNSVSPQHARDILPTCLATTIYVTANFREWKHIIKLRTGTGAHPKIKDLILKVQDKLIDIFPAYFEEPNV